MDICYIVGAGSWYGPDIVPDETDYVIAADGGFCHLKAKGIRTDLLIGDFDSMPRPDFHNIQVHKPEKDDTDLFLCAKEGLKRGYKSFALYGATGGERFDHTLGNLQLLHYLAKNGCKTVLFDEKSVLLALCNDSIAFDESANGYISVFSLSDVSKNVTLRNLKYTVENASLTNDYPLGISNEFIGKPAFISVENGTLLITCGYSAKERWL